MERSFCLDQPGLPMIAKLVSAGIIFVVSASDRDIPSTETPLFETDFGQ